MQDVAKLMQVFIDAVLQDLSGGNVMLTSCQVNPHRFSARVVDFGLARSSDPVQRVSENMYGTITHMAPEMMTGSSAGPVMHHMVLCS